MKSWFRKARTKARKAWTRTKAWVYGILVALGLVVAMPTVAGPISFSWTNATTRTDGTVFDPATEQAEIRLYCNGDASPTFTSPGDANVLDAIVAPGTYTCYATTVDTDGVESMASNTVVKVVEKAPPNPPVLN